VKHSLTARYSRMRWRFRRRLRVVMPIAVTCGVLMTVLDWMGCVPWWRRAPIPRHLSEVWWHFFFFAGFFFVSFMLWPFLVTTSAGYSPDWPL
jgi:hypothetical protein